MSDFFDENDNTIYLLTSKLGEHHCGMIATWVCMASLRTDEIRFTLSLSKFNDSCESIMKTGKFLIHKIPKSEYRTAYRFGSNHSKKIDKFLEDDFEIHSSGLKLFKRATNFGYAEMINTMDTEDRFILYCRLIQICNIKNQDTLKQKDLFELVTEEERSNLSSKYQNDSQRDTPSK